MNGSAEANWAVRDENGSFVSWTEEMGFLWSAKDELPEAGLVCVGRHLARAVTCIAPRLLTVVVAANAVGSDDPVAGAVGEHGPLTSRMMREATGLGKKEVDRAIASLHRDLVLTHAHLVHDEGSWGTLAHDLLVRKWPLGQLPERTQARRELAALVLARTGELSAADLAGVFGWKRREAAALLDEVGTGRDDEAGYRIWTRR